MSGRLYIIDTELFKNTEKCKRIYKQLPEWRQKKVDSLKLDSAKKLSLAAGFLFSLALKNESINPIEARISLEENNKPYLLDYPELSFNLSHSNKKAICIVTPCKNSCDIEMHKEYKEKIAKRFFHENEYDWLESLEEAQKIEAFYRLWTLKESYIKYTGKGMSQDLRSFCFDMHSTFPKIVSGEGNVSCFIKEYPLFEGYSIACMSEENNLPEDIEEISEKELFS